MARTTVARMDIDDREIRDLIRYSEPGYRTAAMRSLNRTGARTLTRTSRGTARQLSLPVRAVRKRGVQRKARLRFLETTVIFYTRPLNPVSHGARQTRSGVAGLGRHWPRSFLHDRSARPELRKVAFQREGRDRYPIEPIKIPVRPTAEAVLKKVVDRAFAEEMAVEFPRQLEFALRQAAAGRRVG